MKIDITENENRWCIEVTGCAKRITTIIKALRKGLEQAGFGSDACMTDASYIIQHLDKGGEWDCHTKDVCCDELDGLLVDHGTISYENITADCDGNYVYGCVSLSKAYYTRNVA